MTTMKTTTSDTPSTFNKWLTVIAADDSLGVSNSTCVAVCVCVSDWGNRSQQSPLNGYNNNNGHVEQDLYIYMHRNMCVYPSFHEGARCGVSTGRPVSFVLRPTSANGCDKAWRADAPTHALNGWMAVRAGTLPLQVGRNSSTCRSAKWTSNCCAHHEADATKNSKVDDNGATAKCLEMWNFVSAIVRPHDYLLMWGFRACGYAAILIKRYVCYIHMCITKYFCFSILWRS